MASTFSNGLALEKKQIRQLSLKCVHEVHHWEKLYGMSLDFFSFFIKVSTSLIALKFLFFIVRLDKNFQIEINTAITSLKLVPY